MSVDKSSVYSYKGYKAYQTRNDNGDLLPIVILRKGKKEMKLNIDIHLSIAETVRLVENAVDKAPA